MIAHGEHIGDAEMRKLTPTLIVSLFICTLLAGVCFNFAREGFRHVDPASKLRLAKEDWQNGQVDRALRGSVTAFGIALECGVRWSVAGIYISRMHSLDSDGQLHEALEQCHTAVQILDGYDDEGGINYVCTGIEERIKRGSLSPVVVTVQDTDGILQVGLQVYAFASDGYVYPGYNETTNASGQVMLKLPQGSYRFRADKDGAQYWSGSNHHCTIPGCISATITVTADGARLR